MAKSVSLLYLGTKWLGNDQDRVLTKSSVVKPASELPVHRHENLYPYSSPSFASSEKQTGRKLKSQDTLSKESSIGKRLEEFKQRNMP